MVGIENFLDFVSATGSPYHSVEACVGLLSKSGFTRLDETTSWNLKPGAKHYVLRNYTAIYAFVVPASVDELSLVIGAGHTDSPCLKVRPVNDQRADGHLLLGCETYGGGLWYTWLDRGLGLCGKVVIRGDAGLEERLVRIVEPVCFVPNLPIHLRTAEERAAFKLNPETELRPVIGMVDSEDATGRFSPVLLELLSKELDVDAASIVDVDLCLFDPAPAQLVGARREFVSTGRIDNQGCTWAAFEALAALSPADATSLSIAVSFDHEEVGSKSWVGADSSMLETLLRKTTRALGMDEEAHANLIRRGVLLSGDMAHALHPNYPGKFQSEHKCLSGKGVVIKENANQRYTTEATTMAVMREVCGRMNPSVPLQDFVVRNDSPCGSTIGPLTASTLGIMAIDFGGPMWAMHSCRETCSASDLVAVYRTYLAFFLHFASVRSQLRQL